jgi:hypothetical protein
MSSNNEEVYAICFINRCFFVQINIHPNDQYKWQTKKHPYPSKAILHWLTNKNEFFI